MIRLLLRSVVFLVSAAIGLLVAAAVIDGVSVTASGLLVAEVVFAVLQSVLAPFLAKVAARNAPAFLGGIGLVSTVVARFIATRVGDALPSPVGSALGRHDGRRVAGHPRGHADPPDPARRDGSGHPPAPAGP
jgi:hypothetical protein